MHHCINLYGEMRTCTNYVRHLLHKNFKVQVLGSALSWKHGPPRPRAWLRENPDHPVTQSIREGTFVLDGTLVCIKDPYAWLASFLEHLEGGIERRSGRHFFSRVKIGSVRNRAALLATRETNGHIRRSMPFISLCCEWYNANYRAWWQMLEVMGKQATFAKHRDLLVDWRACLKRLAERWNLEWRKPREFVEVSGTALPSGKISVEDFPTRDYYLERKYMDRLSPEIKAVIEASIDWPLLKRYGYEAVI